MRKLGLILLLMFGTLCMFAKSQTSSASQTKNTYIVLKYNKTEIDTTPNSVTLDSARIVLFNRFLSDTIPYYDMDNLLRFKLDTLQKKVSQIKAEAEEGGGKTKSWVLILLLAGLGLGIMICVIFLQRNIKRNSKRIDKRKEEIENLQKAIERSLNNNRNQGANSVEKELREIKMENCDLKNRVAAMEDALRKNDVSGAGSLVDAKQQISSKTDEIRKLLYADSIIDGVFSHVKERENDDTIFVLSLKNEDSAYISIFKPAYGRVLANPSYLEGCEKQIIGNSTVEIVQEGEAERVFNGKWRVVSPLMVEIR